MPVFPVLLQRWRLARRLAARGVLLMLVLLGAAFPALADGDYVVHRSFLLDPGGQLGIAEVHQHTGFQATHEPLALGYSDAVVWLRLEVAASPYPLLALVIQPTYLDDLRLFSPAQTGPGWTMQQAGDRHARDPRQLPEINVAFRIHSSPDAPTVHYLRVQTTSVKLLHARALSPTDTQAFDTLVHAGMGAYTCLIFVLMCFALICWRLTHDRLWAFDALLQASTIALGFFQMGFAGKYLFSASPLVGDAGVSVMSCVQVGVASLFFWQLFRAYNAPGWTTLLYRFSVMLLPLLLLLIAVGQPRLAVTVNANLLLLQTLVGAVIIWFIAIGDSVQRRLVRFTYIALLVYLIFYTLPLLGLARATELNLYPALLGNLFTAVMLQVVLVRRTQLQLRERWQLRMQLAETGEKLRWETERRAEATSFLSMLMHEIKTPLTSIRMATQSLVSGRLTEPVDQTSRLHNIQKSVEGIDAVLERCIAADQLEQGELTIHASSHDVGSLLTEWIAAQSQHERLRREGTTRLQATVDAPLLHMMVRNLLANALTYSPEHSTVTIALVEQSTGPASAPVAGFTITVSNRPGRAGAPDPARVFEKYYRAPLANRVSGTGLGLYWVRSVARLLGGEARYRQAPGTDGPRIVFELWLPR